MDVPPRSLARVWRSQMDGRRAPARNLPFRSTFTPDCAEIAWPYLCDRRDPLSDAPPRGLARVCRSQMDGRRAPARNLLFRINCTAKCAENAGPNLCDRRVPLLDVPPRSLARV